MSHGRRKRLTPLNLAATLTLAVLIVLCSIFAVKAWRSRENYQKQNDCAYTLLLAAQAQLNKAGETPGALAALDSATLAYQITPYRLNMDSVTEDGNPVEAQLSKYGSNLRHLMGTADDYRLYCLGRAEKEPTLLYDLLEPYLYDETLLEATICVELDPASGTVYSVLYSDDCQEDEGFAYDDRDGARSITDRTAEARKKLCIGYYGSDSLSHDESRPQIRLWDVELTDNGAALQFRVKNAQIQALRFEIAVFDSLDPASPVMKLNILEPLPAQHSSDAAVDVLVTTREVEDQACCLSAWVRGDTVHICLDGEPPADGDTPPFDLTDYDLDGLQAYCTVCAGPNGLGLDYRSSEIRKTYTAILG